MKRFNSQNDRRRSRWTESWGEESEDDRLGYLEKEKCRNLYVRKLRRYFRDGCMSPLGTMTSLP